MVAILTIATVEICWNSVENFWGEHFGDRVDPVNSRP